MKAIEELILEGDKKEIKNIDDEIYCLGNKVKSENSSFHGFPRQFEDFPSTQKLGLDGQKSSR